jgi:hypothetical protein
LIAQATVDGRFGNIGAEIDTERRHGLEEVEGWVWLCLVIRARVPAVTAAIWLWQLFEFKSGRSQGTSWAASWSRRPLKG